MPITLSVGELIDRLSIATLKVAMLEKALSDETLSDKRRVEIQDQIVNQNTWRNRLVKAIDEFFEEGQATH